MLVVFCTWRSNTAFVLFFVEKKIIFNFCPIIIFISIFQKFRNNPEIYFIMIFNLRMRHPQTPSSIVQNLEFKMHFFAKEMLNNWRVNFSEKKISIIFQKFFFFLQIQNNFSNFIIVFKITKYFFKIWIAAFLKTR